MIGLCRLIIFGCLLNAVLATAAEPALDSGSNSLNSIALLVEQLRFDEALQALKKNAERDPSLPAQLRRLDLEAEIYCQQRNWAKAIEIQNVLDRGLSEYFKDQSHSAPFAYAIQRKKIVRQASIILQGRTAAFFLQPDIKADDDIADNPASLKEAAGMLQTALEIPRGKLSADVLWELQQRLWQASLRRQRPLTAADQAEFRAIYAAGLKLLPNETEQASAAAELCYLAVRQLEQSSAKPLAELLRVKYANTPEAEKVPLLLVLADTLMWCEGDESPQNLLIEAWNVNHAAGALSPRMTLELGLRLSQSKATALPKLNPAWQLTLDKTLRPISETNDSEKLIRNGRLLPVLENLVQECRATGELSIAKECAASLLSLKKLLWNPNSLQIADAHALYASFLAESSDKNERRLAIEQYDSALAIWEPQVKSDRRKLQIAETQNSLAILQLEQRRTDRAISLLDAAEIVFKDQGIRDQRLAQLDYGRGFLLSSQGNYARAASHFEEAESLCREVRRKLEKPNVAIDRLYDAIALSQIQCLKFGNKLPAAISRCEECVSKELVTGEARDTIRVWGAMFELERLSLLQKDKRSVANNFATYQNILQSLQSLIEKAGSAQADPARGRQTAEAFYASALCHFNAALESGNPAGNATAAEKNSAAKAAAKELHRAWDDCQIAYQQARERGWELLELRTLQLLGKIQLHLMARRDADPQLLAAAVMSEDQLSRVLVLSAFLEATPILQYQALETAARLLRAKNSTHAYETLDRALKTIESRRSFGMLTPEECAHNFARFAGGFDQLVDWCCEDAAESRAALEKAILSSDRKRSRTFLDQLYALQRQTATPDNTAKPSNSLDNPAHALRQRQALLKQFSEGLLAQTNLPSKEYADRLFAEIERLEKLYPEETSGITTAKLPDNLAFLANRAVPTHVCYYHIGRKQSYLFHLAAIPGQPLGITVNRLQITASQAGRLQFDQANLRTETISNETAARSVFPVALNDSLACTLTNALLEHLQAPPRPEPRLDYDQRLAIAEILLPESVREAIRRQPAALLLWVPDGPLQRVPFEALTFGRAAGQREHYLLDDPAFPPAQYVPSLAIFQQLSNTKRIGFPGTVLSLGNPDYKRAAPVEPQAKPLPELPETEREQKALHALFSKHAEAAKNFFQREQATEANFRKHAAAAQLIHLAAHASASETHEKLEATVHLAPRQPGAEDAQNDGKMTLKELRELSFPECELAILAACQTNVGKQLPLEAGSTIARAFLEKGARRVLCSQWELADQATADLLCDYFPRLAKLDSAAAHSTTVYATELQLAKRAIRAKYPEPHHWAPLILIGCD